MIGAVGFWAGCALLTQFVSAAPPVQRPLSEIQTELVQSDGDSSNEAAAVSAPRKLRGKFLHITGTFAGFNFDRDQLLTAIFLSTDIHPDPYYKAHSSTSDEGVCHNGDGSAGYYGAETTSCDSPFHLVNATFDWLEENMKDEIDFIIWTGDSARHDNDEENPRTEDEVVASNEKLVAKFREVWGKDDNINDTDPTNDFMIPVIPTLGNNDVLPHNIFREGPNTWTKHFAHIWDSFIPEAQRHTFQQGGFFYTEVIPNHLAVFSLNTLYFFDSNSYVDGCDAKSEPGYAHMEWLRIQLQIMRQRGMKAIMMGHVPPARTETKQSWDETCWQKYTLWMQQYRDVVIGGIFGHMNIDHFMLQDNHELEYDLSASGRKARSRSNPFGVRELLVNEDGEMTITKSADYLEDLRNLWARLPTPPSGISLLEAEEELDEPESWWEALASKLGSKKKGKKSKKDKEKEKRKFLKKIGGEFAERYSVSIVSPSVVPNYFPTIRIIEYNISGLEDAPTFGSRNIISTASQQIEVEPVLEEDAPEFSDGLQNDEIDALKKKKDKKEKKHPSFTVPKPPKKSAPPGPAYSNQPLTFLSYTQYWANLTYINNDFTHLEESEDFDDERWRDGKHSGKKKNHKTPKPNKFSYQIEYDTKNDSINPMPDLTVRSWVNLAMKLGKGVKGNSQPKSKSGGKGKTKSVDVEQGAFDEIVADVRMWLDQEYEEAVDEVEDETSNSTPIAAENASDADIEAEDDTITTTDKKKNKKKGKKKKNKAWHAFLKRAFVGSQEEES